MAQEFMDDFLAEAEQLLGSIRKHLLVAEERPLKKEDIQDLFRAFHTLKGISGMMGFVAVESIAHQLEAILKEIQKNDDTLSSNQLDVFLKGVQLIENNLAKQGDGSSEVIKKWELVAESVNVLASGAAQKNNIIPQQPFPQSVNPKTFRVVFTSSRENLEKKITVNSIRETLLKHTSIISSKPITGEKGELQFEFIVSTSSECEKLTELLPAEVICHEILSDSSEPTEQSGMKPAESDTETPVEQKVTSEASSASNMSILRSGMIRVEVSRLEELMTMVGELVISRSRLDESIQSLGHKVDEKLKRPIEEVNQMMEKQLRALREGVMRIRMVPMADAFDKMKYVIQDMVRETQKKVQLKVSGRETEIDKYIVEKILDSLLHIVRNALSHGIEMPEEREEAGKPPVGTISLNAFAAGDSVIIEIEDDGRGINKEKLIERAIASGMNISKSDVSHQDFLDMMCMSGVSSLENADKYSGRGVGMNVAWRTIQDLGGTIDFESTKGKGTKFMIELPLTIAILDALILKIGATRFALPQSMVNEVIQIDTNELVNIENNKLLSWRGGVLPVIRMADQFKLPVNGADTGILVVVGSGLKSLGIQVDRIEGIREIVVRSLTDPLVKVPGISGATELGDGKIILILDAPALIKHAINIKMKKKKTVSF